MRESQMRRIVVEILKPLAAFPVESSTSVGQPDVCCVAGWIELKVARRPERHATIVAIDLRPSQRLWLTGWARAGGRAWTLTKLDDTWLLHGGTWASANLGRVGEIVLQHAATRVWHGPPRDLCNALVESCRSGDL